MRSFRIAKVRRLGADWQDPPMKQDNEGRKARNGFIHDIIARYKERDEWEILGDIRVIVEDIERTLGEEDT